MTGHETFKSNDREPCDRRAASKSLVRDFWAPVGNTSYAPGPANLAVGRFSTPSRNAARTIAHASMDSPRVRAPRRVSAIICAANRTTVSPRSMSGRPAALRRRGRPRTHTRSVFRGASPLQQPLVAAAVAGAVRRSTCTPSGLTAAAVWGLLVRINFDRHHPSRPSVG
jgi:hypothetical protein